MLAHGPRVAVSQMIEEALIVRNPRCCTVYSRSQLLSEPSNFYRPTLPHLTIVPRLIAYSYVQSSMSVSIVDR